ncbi:MULTISPECIES: hypothetical protein [Pseudomonas]|uniref:Secreted protein n=1 Tax=Pseudomonas farsensis TaxID=2745492 RepID=A0ABU8QUC2_9PSED|nr:MULTISPECIES: hypothetical protein [Pseudomonas]MBC3412636.1 hypothetical protein [Pseudomonas sp. SWRI51]MBV4530335.1 hypothetical protein [Pseudomonas farsensis]
MNLSKYLLLAILALGSTSVFAEGGAERSKQFWQAFREDQARLYGNDQAQAVAEREREAKARKVAKD